MKLSKQEKLILDFFDPEVVELFNSKTITDFFWNADGKVFFIVDILSQLKQGDSL